LRVLGAFPIDASRIPVVLPQVLDDASRDHPPSPRPTPAHLQVARILDRDLSARPDWSSSGLVHDFNDRTITVSAMCRRGCSWLRINRRRPMNRNSRVLATLVVLIVIGAGLYLYVTRSQPPVQPASEPSAPPEATSAEAIRHPIEKIAPGAPGADAAGETLPPLDDSDTVVESAMKDLVGAGAVLDLAGSGDYIRKVVVTVDNLPRNRASSRLWPVPPTPGRFTVRQEGDRTYLSAENFERYSPFVNLATSVDMDRLVALYVRYYPLFQQAYEKLGYPGRYFNDRVVEVIDHLLATPEPGGDIELVLPPQDPSIEVPRPWVLYQYADPALQSLSAGQKILVRMGNENARRVKTVLRELRTRLAAETQRPAASPAAGSP
jgi:hypothetical protein